MEAWDDIWGRFEGISLFGRRLKGEQAKALAKIVSELKLPKDSKIIDVGCGIGANLVIFRNLGYSNSIGIDTSQNALEISARLFALRKGKDTFLMDARNIKFLDNSFDLVFSDGLLEHFEDPPLDIVGELCRISKKWILLFQPNQTSLFGRVKWLYQKLGKASWAKEYPYSKRDYVTMFAKFRFSLAGFGSINLQEAMWLLLSKERTSVQ